MEKYRALIIDDEPLARSLLRRFLSSDRRIEVVGECGNGFEGALAIQELRPDLVFLDIQMPKINGFEMLELLSEPPLIIFSTAYEQFAIRAFEANAVDYLLKPYPAERVAVAVEKAIAKMNGKSIQVNQIDALISSHDEVSGQINRVVVKSGKKIHIIPVDSIEYIESQDDFVMIYCADGHFMKQKTMKFFETHLDSNKFIRIHRTYLVNVSQITEIQQYGKDSWIIVTKQGSKLKVSKFGYVLLKENLNI
jgi:two-component system, LytTR family, response regulator